MVQSLMVLKDHQCQRKTPGCSDTQTSTSSASNDHHTLLVFSAFSLSVVPTQKKKKKRLSASSRQDIPILVLIISTKKGFAMETTEGFILLGTKFSPSIIHLSINLQLSMDSLFFSEIFIYFFRCGGGIPDNGQG